MQTIILTIKGFFIGIAKIIPGVSGAMLMITMGIYDKCLKAITNFFDNKSKNIKLLLPIGFGMFLGILTFSKIVKLSLENYYFITMLFFLGLIFGGIPPLFKEIKNKKNYALTLIFGLIIIGLSFLSTNNNYQMSDIYIIDFIWISISGIVDALAMVVPGISGTALLMLMGFYDIIIKTLSEMDSVQNIINNLNILVPYTIGLILGFIGTAKIMSYLFDKSKEKTYASIIGLTIATTILLIIKTFTEIYDLRDLLIGLLLFICGYFIAKKLG